MWGSILASHFVFEAAGSLVISAAVCVALLLRD